MGKAPTDPKEILKGAMVMSKRKVSWRDEFGDGRCSRRIKDIVEKELRKR